MGRPIPDQMVVRRAYELLLAGETDMQRYVREEWEAAMGGVRVALDAVRRLWPNESDFLSADARLRLREACSTLAVTFDEIDSLADEMLGERMMMALHGNLTMEELENPGKEAAR